MYTITYFFIKINIFNVFAFLNSVIIHIGDDFLWKILYNIDENKFKGIFYGQKY